MTIPGLPFPASCPPDSCPKGAGCPHDTVVTFYFDQPGREDLTPARDYLARAFGIAAADICDHFGVRRETQVVGLPAGMFIYAILVPQARAYELRDRFPRAIEFVRPLTTPTQPWRPGRAWSPWPRKPAP